MDRLGPVLGMFMDLFDEVVIGIQLHCESCRHDPTSKKGLESRCEHNNLNNRKTNIKGHCFTTTNPDFWNNWSHWSIPGELNELWPVNFV
jgi:hypothetical protein